MLGLFELVLLGLLIWGLSRGTQTANQIKALEEQVRLLKNTVDYLQSRHQQGLPANAAPVTTPAPAMDPLPAPSKPSPRRSWEPVPAASTPPAAKSPRQEWAMPDRISPGPKRKSISSQTRQEWETLVGEKLLNRVGAIALIIGVGLFLKYAFDRDWISPAIRVALGGAVGLGLIFWASRQRNKLPVFAQGLLGTGISILYLSIYASFSFYRLIPSGVAFGLMAVTTALSFERAVRFESRAVGLLAYAGGYLTPFLLSPGGTGGPSGAIGLFGYLILLQAGLLALAAREPAEWGILHPLTLFGTYVTFFLWSAARYQPVSFWPATIFLIIAWGMFVGIELYQKAAGEPRDNPPLDEPVQDLLSWVNALVFYGLLYGLLRSISSDWLAGATLLIGVAYSLPSLLFKEFVPSYALKAVVFLALATKLQLNGFALAIAWALEGLGLIAAGMKFKLVHLRMAGLALFAACLGALVFAPGALALRSFDGYLPLLNTRGLTFAGIAAVLAAASFAYGRFEASGAGDDAFPLAFDATEAQWAEAALNYSWAALLFALLTVEINDFFRSQGAGGVLAGSRAFTNVMSMSAAWAGYSLVLTWQASRRSSDSVMRAGLAIGVVAAFVAVLRGAAFEPIGSYQAVANSRFVVMAFISVCIYFVSRALESSEIAWAQDVIVWIRAGVAGIMLVLLTSEIRDFYRNRIELEGRSPQLTSQLHLALSAGWLLYSSAALTIGFWLRKPNIRITAVALLGVTVLKVFLYDLSFLQQLHRIISFMALGVILMAASYVYQRYGKALFGPA